MYIEVYTCTLMCKMTLVLSSCPCSMLHDGYVKLVWSREQQLFEGLSAASEEAYVGLTGQAVKGSH